MKANFENNLLAFKLEKNHLDKPNKDLESAADILMSTS